MLTRYSNVDFGLTKCGLLKKTQRLGINRCWKAREQLSSVLDSYQSMSTTWSHRYGRWSHYNNPNYNQPICMGVKLTVTHNCDKKVVTGCAIPPSNHMRTLGNRHVCEAFDCCIAGFDSRSVADFWDAVFDGLFNHW